MPKKCPAGSKWNGSKCVKTTILNKRDKNFQKLIKTRPEQHAYSEFDKQLIVSEIKRRKRLGFDADEVPPNETILRSFYASRLR